VLVLGLPRGGVPVAFEVARALHAPLDAMIVRKIGMPGQPEFAIGAVASGGIVVRQLESAPRYADFEAQFEQLVQREIVELERRELAYRGDAPPLDLHDRSVVLVDDGLATGATMMAALRAARQAGAARVVVAAPVASEEAAAMLGDEADETVILQTPAYLVAIGQWYERFDQLRDEEVQALLERARGAGADPGRRRERLGR